MQSTLHAVGKRLVPEEFAAVVNVEEAYCKSKSKLPRVLILAAMRFMCSLFCAMHAERYNISNTDSKR
jgi:hypothetical protein